MIKEKELNMSMRCIKYMVFVANFMFVLVGFLLISIGTTVKAIYSDFDEFLMNHYYNPSRLAIAVGIIIFIVSLFGCLGALKQSVCLMNLYAFLLSLVLILEVSISVTAFAMRGSLRNNLKFQMLDSMNYYDSYTNFVWDATQFNLGCCGVYDPDDWRQFDGKYNLKRVSYLRDVGSSNGTTNASTVPDYKYIVPSTCCRWEECTTVSSVYKHGCWKEITTIISSCALLLGIGAVCIAFIQLLGIIFAHLLAKSIRRLKTQIQVDRMERRQHIYEQFTQGSLNNEKVSPVLYTPSSSEA